MKKPWLAALLNFLFFGAGTLYLGQRRLPAALVTVGGLLVQGFEIKVSPAFDNALPALYPFLLGGLIVLKVGLTIQGYQDAKALNAGRG